MADRMAPGHVYQPRLGTGIEWQEGVARLWEGGAVTATVPHATHTPYEFWHSLAFAGCFPEVTHWWFRSAWTQRVRLTRPQGMMNATTVWGWMQFIDEQTPAQMYTVTEGERPVISTPYPSNEVQPVNLPLRLALARLVAGILSDQVVPDRWLFVTSLVGRDELAAVFPESEAALPWRLTDVNGPLRLALCELQGIQP